MARFIDELDIYAKAGDGGDGVVRFRHLKFQPMGGPSGGNGGDGGDVYLRAVRNLSLLSKYTGNKEFKAERGEDGQGDSMYGKGSDDLYIDVPVGSMVTDLERSRTYSLLKEDQIEKILHGGRGGLGNEYYKSSTNRTPRQSTEGKSGEESHFKIELSLVVDVGFIGLPNAGKSTLLNLFTNASSAIGAYPFTTLEPHLGDLFGFVLADIPGLVEGAAEGKGLGHRFLRHVTKTKMLLHLVSLEEEHPLETYYTIRKELSDYDKTLAEKEEWIILTKKDLTEQHKIDLILKEVDKDEKRVFVTSAETGEGIKELQDALVQHLRER